MTDAKKNEIDRRFKHIYSMRVFGGLICSHDYNNAQAKSHVNHNLQMVSDCYTAGMPAKDTATILAGTPLTALVVE